MRSGLVATPSAYRALMLWQTLTSDQAHYAINATTPRGFSNPDDLVEGGQLMLLNVNLPAVAGKDACKDAGWSWHFRTDGGEFKNQGDCIQYVNTGK